MVLAERNSEIVRNGRRSRGPSPNGHGASSGGGSAVGAGGTGTPETSSDDDNSIKRNGKSKTKQSEYEEKIRVGRDYQAVCPSLIPEHDRKPEGLNDRALLVWSPTREIPDTKLEEYISVAKEKYGYNGEQALGMLFWHKHDLERAVMDLANFTPFPDEWTVEDKVLFEQAFQFHGKSFHRIRQMLPDKSIASLVKYYYSWKKTRHRQSAMDRPEKSKANKDSSENGSDNGSNEDSDEDKEQAMGLQDHILSKLVGSVNSSGGTGGGSGGDALGKPSKQSEIPTFEANSESTMASTSINNASVAVAVVSSKLQQRQQTPPTSNTDTSCTGISGGRSTPANSNGIIASAGGYCSNCGVTCNSLHISPHGKLCLSCHHHWRRTGTKRPTSGPYIGKRSRDRNAERHKRKPPRGMYINHDDILLLASADNQGALFHKIDREIISVMNNVQQNKQTMSTLKRKLPDNTQVQEVQAPESSPRMNSRWSSDELLLAVQGVRKYGKDFQAIAEAIGTKTEAHVRTFYVNNRRRYNLDQVLKKYEADREASIIVANVNETASAINSKKDETKKFDSIHTVTTTATASVTASTVTVESNTTTSSETTNMKSANDESKLFNNSTNLPKDSIIMQIDLDAEQPDLEPTSKKIALSVTGQDLPKGAAV